MSEPSDSVSPGEPQDPRRGSPLPSETSSEEAARVRAVLDASLDAIISIDHEGCIIEFSAAAENIFGWKRSEVMGEPISDHIVPERMRRAHQDGMARYLSTGEAHVLGKRLELPAVRKDGTEFPVELAIVRLPGSEPPTFTAFLRDITYAQEQRAALEAAMSQVQAASAAKSEFMAVMSHEIRTPMNAVLGMTDLVLDTTLTREQQGLLQTVQANAESLLAIINDILDFSKIEAGSAELREDHLAIADVVEGVAEALAPRGFGKGVQVVAVIDPQLPPVVLGDTGRIRQILVNLAGNAVKFTEQGEVVLRAEVVTDDGDVARIRFVVADTGVGIGEEDLTEVFRPFVQADSSLARQHGGTGLGLGITQALVEAMDGTIRASSVLGQGSTFFVEIPFRKTSFRFDGRRASDRAYPEFHGAVRTDAPMVRQAVENTFRCLGASVGDDRAPDTRSVLVLDAAQQTPGPDWMRDVIAEHSEENALILVLAPPGDRPQGIRAPALVLSKPFTRRKLARTLLDAVKGRQPQEHLVEERARDTEDRRPHGPKVLVVEDNWGNQRYVLRVLEDGSYRTDLAQDGEEGARMAMQGRFDLIITDIQMPNVDGFEMTRRIREHEASSGGPRVPILALTAHAGIENKRECLDAGMDGFLSKPYRAPELLSLVAEILGALPVVLILDDDADSRTLMRRYLDSERVKVVEASSVEEARSAVSAHKPQIVLLDRSLPDGNGLDFAREITHGDNPPEHVIAVTGYVGADAQAVAAEAGCNAFLSKPVRRAAFQDVVGVAIGGLGSRPGPSDSGADLEASTTHEGAGPAVGPPRSSDGVVVTIDPDIVDLVPGFFAARSGVITSLMQSLADEDYAGIKTIGHNIAGSGLGYGFAEITRLGRAMEEAAEERALAVLSALIDDLAAYLDTVVWQPRSR
jgi:PAS domain S-box-containing protein